MKKLGFGCMRLPLLNKEDQKSIDYEQVNKMFDMFLERGFTYFDTAYMYHDYISEEVVKKCLVQRHPRESFTLATKMPTMFLKEKSDHQRIFNEQLEKCGVDYFDYYLLHNLNVANYKTATELGTFDYAIEKKDEGKIKELGFSFHDNAKLLDEILSEHPEVDFVQLQINYLDWDNQGIQSGDCYKVAKKYNKKVIVMEPVKGGTLANVPEKVEQLFKDYNPSYSVASWAIRFAASLDNVMVVLSGMSNLEQVEDNTSYMTDFVKLDETQDKLIEKAVEIINDSIKIPCTACRYCVEDCPQQIAIPEYFALYNNKVFINANGHTIQNLYYDNLVKKGHGRAQDCIECGACESHCPQHIEIIDSLKKLSTIFDK